MIRKREDRGLVCQPALRRVRGLPLGRVLPWPAVAVLRADAVVVLDVPAETAQERILTRGEDQETLTYLGAARTAHLHFARARGWSVVDATGPIGAVLTRIEAADSRSVRGHLGRAPDGTALGQTQHRFTVWPVQGRRVQ